MTAQPQPKYAAKVPEAIQTPDVVETSRLGRLEFFDEMPAMATGITPAMAHSEVGQGSAYAFTPHDAQGRFLDGGKTYRVTLPSPVPVAQFWSFVVYSGHHRSLLETDQKNAGKEGNWVQTMPGKSWSALLSLYGPLEPWFDKSWKPGDFELVNG